jgi:hypothetical protein
MFAANRATGAARADITEDVDDVLGDNVPLLSERHAASQQHADAPISHVALATLGCSGQGENSTGKAHAKESTCIYMQNEPRCCRCCVRVCGGRVMRHCDRCLWLCLADRLAAIATVPTMQLRSFRCPRSPLLPCRCVGRSGYWRRAVVSLALLPVPTAHSCRFCLEDEEDQDAECCAACCGAEGEEEGRTDLMGWPDGPSSTAPAPRPWRLHHYSRVGIASPEMPSPPHLVPAGGAAEPGTSGQQARRPQQLEGDRPRWRRVVLGLGSSPYHSSSPSHSLGPPVPAASAGHSWLRRWAGRSSSSVASTAAVGPHAQVARASDVEAPSTQGGDPAHGPAAAGPPGGADDVAFEATAAMPSARMVCG